jgi:Protein of unknown function (DUF559)
VKNLKNNEMADRYLERSKVLLNLPYKKFPDWFFSSPPLPRGRLGGGERDVINKPYNQLNKKSLRKELRSNAPAPEKILWNKIRCNQLGIKFRRQYGIGLLLIFMRHN